jgi:hypothetical protein
MRGVDERLNTPYALSSSFISFGTAVTDLIHSLCNFNENQ